MNLVLDIGNTRTKLGFFRGNQLVEQRVLSSLMLQALHAALEEMPWRYGLWSATAQLAEPIAYGLDQTAGLQALNAQTPLPFQNHYGSPATLGTDRLAAVAAAFHLFPSQNCLVIDAGTCITYDWLTAAGEYLGGNIAPGLRMRLEAMHRFTGRLPLVEKAPLEALIGDHTESAIRNGALVGALLEVEGYVRWTQQQIGDVQVLCTGGDVDFFGNHFKSQIFAHPDLVLIGLNQILLHNAPDSP